MVGEHAVTPALSTIDRKAGILADVAARDGAAAHKGKPGDLLVILTFVSLNPEEASVWEPRLVLVGKDNKSHEPILPHKNNP